MNEGQAGRGALVWKSTQGDSPGKNTLPDRGRGVLQLPPGLGGVEVAWEIGIDIYTVLYIK